MGAQDGIPVILGAQRSALAVLSLVPQVVLVLIARLAIHQCLTHFVLTFYLTSSILSIDYE